MSTAKIIELLQQVEADETVKPTQWLTDGTEDDQHPLVNKITWEADRELITTAGHPNFAAHRELANAGFPVRKGESDSFGWLSGVIKTKKGDIVYG